MKYTPASVAATAACPGYGMSNNRVVWSPDNPTEFNISQNTGVPNGALQYHKVGRYIDANIQDNGMINIVHISHDQDIIWYGTIMPWWK